METFNHGSGRFARVARVGRRGDGSGNLKMAARLAKFKDDSPLAQANLAAAKLFRRFVITMQDIAPPNHQMRYKILDENRKPIKKRGFRYSVHPKRALSHINRNPFHTAWIYLRPFVNLPTFGTNNENDKPYIGFEWTENTDATTTWALDLDSHPTCRNIADVRD